jgi:LacI family transcriptional regulator
VVTIRQVAKLAGVHAATVSRALKGDPWVADATREKVLRAARELGYRLNPYVSAFMSYQRGGRKRVQHLSVAFISFLTNLALSRRSHILQIYESIKARGAELGYHVEHFSMAEPGMTAKRMSQILQTRDIQGVILGAIPKAHADFRLEWEKFAPVSATYEPGELTMHTVAPDYFRDATIALQKLEHAGYRKVGLFLPPSIDSLSDQMWMGAYAAYFRRPDCRISPIPIHAPEKRMANTQATLRWFRKHKPDAIVGIMYRELRRAFASGGVSIPGDVSFVHLGMPPTENFAGFRRDAVRIGCITLEQVDSLLQRNEFGLPSKPCITLVPGLWNGGFTALKVN